MLFTENFTFKIVLFKIASKKQDLRILRGKLDQNVFFCVPCFFQIHAFEKYGFLQNHAF